MEPDPSQRPPMEVLVAGRPAGAFGSRLGRLLERPAVRLVGLAGVALALVAAWFLTSSDEEPAVEAQDAGPFIAPLSQVTPGADRGIDPWRITSDVAVTFLPDGRVVSFSARNGGSRPRDARELFMRVDYVGGGASSYIFSCVGAEDAAVGEGRQRGLVPAGGEVAVRCEDTVLLNGKPSRLPPEVLTVVTEPPSQGNG